MIIDTRRALIDEAAEKAAAVIDVLEASDRFVTDVPEKAEDLIGYQMLVEATLLAHLVDIAENHAAISSSEIRTRLKQIVATSPADEF